MTEEKDAVERRFFIGWIAVSVAALTSICWFRKKQEAEKPRQIPMLTQDGRLVHIDAAHLEQAKTRQVTKEELQTWVKNKP